MGFPVAVGTIGTAAALPWWRSVALVAVLPRSEPGLGRS